MERKEYFRIDMENGDVHEAQYFTGDEVANRNHKLRDAGEPDRWIPYGQREEESAAA